MLELYYTNLYIGPTDRGADPDPPVHPGHDQVGAARHDDGRLRHHRRRGARRVHSLWGEHLLYVYIIRLLLQYCKIITSLIYC